MNRYSILVLLLTVCILIGCGHKTENLDIDVENQDANISVNINDDIVIKDYSNLTEIKIDSVSLFNPDKLSELEQDANYIVEGVFLDDSRIDLQYGPYGNIAYGCTFSTFQVNKVHEGDLSVGDKIEITEPYYILDDEETIYHMGNYYPSDPGRKYILFMLKNPAENNSKNKDIYSSVGYELGRFALVEEAKGIAAFSNKTMNLGSGDSAIYRSIYEEVIDKYMN